MIKLTIYLFPCSSHAHAERFWEIAAKTTEGIEGIVCDASVKRYCVEVDQKSESNIGELHGGQHLPLVDSGELLNRFDFHNQRLLDIPIKPVAAVEPYVLVLKRPGGL